MITRARGGWLLLSVVALIALLLLTPTKLVYYGVVTGAGVAAGFVHGQATAAQLP